MCCHSVAFCDVIAIVCISMQIALVCFPYLLLHILISQGLGQHAVIKFHLVATDINATYALVPVAVLDDECTQLVYCIVVVASSVR